MTAVAPGVVVFNTQFSAGESTVVAESTGMQRSRCDCQLGDLGRKHVRYDRGRSADARHALGNGLRRH